MNHRPGHVLILYDMVVLGLNACVDKILNSDHGTKTACLLEMG